MGETRNEVSRLREAGDHPAGRTIQPNEEDFRRLDAERLQIETRGPPVKRWLDLMCHNEIAHAMGLNDVYEVPFWARLTAQWRSGASIRPKLIKT